MAGKRGEFAIAPVVAGQLTLVSNLPAPGWNNGDTPEGVKDGYEYCLAANIAWRLGLDRVKFVNVDYDMLVGGKVKDFDLALSQISITEKRKEVAKFSAPYFENGIGLLVKKGRKLSGGDIGSLRIGVQMGTVAADFVPDRLKPKVAAKVYPDAPALFTALMADKVDAVMTDTTVVLEQAAASRGKLEVVGQYSTGEQFGALFPKTSADAAILDKVIASLIADGTTNRLSSKYLAAAFGGDPNGVPYFKP